MQTYTKREHYITEKFLLNFANQKNQVNEYIIKSEKLIVNNIKNSMVEKDIYEHPYIERNTLENFFGKIENYFIPRVKDILIKIADYRKNGNTISFEEIKLDVEKNIVEMLFFYYRSGAILYEASFFRKQKKDGLLNMLSIFMDINYVSKLAKTITTFYNFSIIQSDHGFLLSDQFLSTAALSIKGQYSNVSNRNIGFKDVLILIPLSNNFYIVYSNGNNPDYIKSNTLNILNEKETNEINSVILNNSYKKCISLSKSSMVMAIENYDKQSPVSTFSYFGSGKVVGNTLKKEVFFYPEDRNAWELLRSGKVFGLKHLKRNDKCKCGSGKKHKKCCMESKVKVFSFLDKQYKIRPEVHINATNEAQIDQVVGFKEDEFWEKDFKFAREILDLPHKGNSEAE